MTSDQSTSGRRETGVYNDVTGINYRNAQVVIGYVKTFPSRKSHKYIAVSTRTSRSWQFPLVVGVTDTAERAKELIIDEYEHYGLDRN